MKNVLTLFALCLSLSSMAETKIVEFESDLELKCHKELTKLGCTTSDGEQNAECALKNKSKLSSSCVDLQDEKETSR